MKARYLQQSQFCFFAHEPNQAAEPFSINDALRQAVQRNPGVVRPRPTAVANRKSSFDKPKTLLLRCGLKSAPSRKKSTRCLVSFPEARCPIPAVGTGSWRNGSQGSLVVRQTLLMDSPQFMTLASSARVKCSGVSRTRTNRVDRLGRGRSVCRASVTRLVSSPSKTWPTTRRYSRRQLSFFGRVEL